MRMLFYWVFINIWKNPWFGAVVIYIYNGLYLVPSFMWYETPLRRHMQAGLYKEWDQAHMSKSVWLPQSLARFWSCRDWMNHITGAPDSLRGSVMVLVILFADF